MRFIMLVVLLDMMSIGLIVPVLPALVGRYTDGIDAQAAAYSLVTFSFALASFVSAPLLGALSDRYGRRPVLLLGFCGLAINFFWTAAATSLWMLVASRVVGGAMNVRAVSDCWAPCSASASSSGRRSAASWVPSTCDCRLSWPVC
jgi:DHA1 family tetracycline resistance protein-like MFS transporter